MKRFFKRIQALIAPAKSEEQSLPTIVTGEMLINSFQDTWALSFSPELYNKTIMASEQSRVYSEGVCAHVQRQVHACEITVSANTTFAEAKKYIGNGRVAVLNFANPVNPGGGILSGAIAQEECLCRSSNLYACLVAEHLYQDYYGYHQNRHYQYSDRLIYSRGVTVFKDDALVPQMLPAEDWFEVDVITCAAPFSGNVGSPDSVGLTLLFKSRIKNILEAALDNKADTIVLGAFGCGAFNNPPQVVADAFLAVLEEGAYRNAFKRIVFAIKKESEDTNGENFCVFAKTFGINPDQEVFVAWQRQNPYYQKRISILGDSVSTLEGHNPEGYNVFYKGEICQKANVREMKDTWWGQLINVLGATLLVNNSWSGSRVSRLPGWPSVFPSGCSDERTSGLHTVEAMPDVILVYLGTNDWGNGVLPEANHTDPDNEFVFRPAYERMIQKLRTNYPYAQICCCTLNTTYMSQNPQFVFPASFGGVHMDEYNSVIRSVADSYQCKLIDLARYQTPYDAIDGSHPNADGMKVLAAMMLRELDETGYKFII